MSVGVQGRCERSSEVFVKIQKTFFFIFIFYFFFGGGGGSGGRLEGSGWMRTKN